MAMVAEMVVATAAARSSQTVETGMQNPGYAGVFLWKNGPMDAERIELTEIKNRVQARISLRARHAQEHGAPGNI